MKKTLTTLFFGLLGSAFLMAQSSVRLDSLLALLPASKPDTARVNLLNEISHETHMTFKFLKYREALGKAKEAEKLAASLGFARGQAIAFERQALPFIYVMKLDSAIFYFQKELEVAEKNHLEGTRIHALNGLGDSYLRKRDLPAARRFLHRGLNLAMANKKYLRYQGYILENLGHARTLESQYIEGIDTLIMAANIYRQLPDNIFLSQLANVIAQNYLSLGQLEQAEAWSKTTFETAEKTRDEGLQGWSQLSLGEVYLQQKKLADAEIFLKKTLSSAEKLQNRALEALTYMKLSQLAEQRKEYQNQLEFMLKAKELDANNAALGGAGPSLLLGKAYLRLGQSENAEKSLLQAVSIGQKTGDWPNLASAYAGLSELAAEKKDFKRAFEYAQKRIAARDTFYTADNTRKLTQIEMTHEYEQKRALAEAKQEKETALHEAQNRQQLILIVSIFGLAILGSQLWFSGQRRRQERKRNELELAALRSQMNPHFFFNALSTLDSFIAENRNAEAQNLLQKFSRLSRLVLENSTRPLVPLEDDFAALKLYVELEQARFQNSFSVEWKIDPEVLEENPFVPPLLVQPFVENAILHGLRLKKESDKKLEIHLRREAANLIFEISDNGVGRQQAQLLASPKPAGQTSLGGKLTERRIELFNQNRQQAATVEVEDLFAEKENSGTRVVLRLPVG